MREASRQDDVSLTLDRGDEPSLILQISVEETPLRITGWDSLLDYKFRVEEPFIEERLTEKIMAGKLSNRGVVKIGWGAEGRFIGISSFRLSNRGAVKVGQGTEGRFIGIPSDFVKL